MLKVFFWSTNRQIYDETMFYLLFQFFAETENDTSCANMSNFIIHPLA